MKPRNNTGRLSPAARVLVLSSGLALVAVALSILVAVGHGAVRETPFAVALPILIVLFILSELFIVQLETRGDAHTVTFSEIPMVVALAFASPANLIIGRLIGAALVLGFKRRQSARKLFFNLALFGVESSLAIALYRAVLGNSDPIDPMGWLAAFVALPSVYLLSAGAVTLVITLNSGYPGHADVRRVITVGSLTAIANTGIGLGIVGALYQDARLAYLVSIVAVLLWLISRSYMALVQRYSSLEALHAFTRAVDRPSDTVAIAKAVLAAARDLLRAEYAALLLLNASGDAVVITDDGTGSPTTRELDHDRAQADLDRLLPDGSPAVLRIDVDRPDWLRTARLKDAAATPLQGEGAPSGMILVANRQAVTSTFEEGDLAVFETLANHAGVALENGRLFDQLNREVAERTHQAFHDALTGLPNREMLNMRLNEAIATADRVDRCVAVLLLDLEGFKEVNDTLGHSTGDLVLQQVAQRLTEALPPEATLARFGGDEFVAIAQVASRSEAVRLADHMLTKLASPFVQGELSLAIGASVGVAVFPEHGTEPATLLQRADIAMYGAKGANIGYDLYSVDRDPFTSRRLALVGTLREAIGREEIEVYFQPQVDLVTNLTVGAEGLVRWRHPELGLLSPGEFVDAVEQTSIIQPLTSAVLRVALAGAKGWRDNGYDLGISVNLSVRSLLDPALPGEVLDALVATRIPAEHLTLEITENSMMFDSRRLTSVLSQLREMGVRLSIDDFGTGYSSLAHLRRLPVSEIKIDKTFVVGLTIDQQDAAIVSSTIELGHQLGLRVVAEGVENQDAIQRLADYGCDAVQGFAISRPLSAAHFEVWLGRHDVARLPRV